MNSLSSNHTIKILTLKHVRIFDPLLWLSGIAVIGFIVGLYLALFHAPSDNLQGEVQRIFYLHLASFVGAFAGFISAFVASLAYLRTRHMKWDILALAGIEVGLVLASINVITGAIYARPIVNSWWTWDPKLTAVTIMVLTYASYLMLRQGVENPERRRTFAAVYGVLAFVTVMYTFIIIRIRSDVLHEVMFKPDSGLFALPEPMQFALFGNMLIWGALIAPTLIIWCIRLEHLHLKNELLRHEIMHQ